MGTRRPAQKSAEKYGAGSHEIPWHGIPLLGVAHRIGRLLRYDRNPGLNSNLIPIYGSPRRHTPGDAPPGPAYASSTFQDHRTFGARFTDRPIRAKILRMEATLLAIRDPADREVVGYTGWIITAKCG